MFVIRSFEPKDEHSVVHLWESCALTRPWNNPYDDIRRSVEHSSSALLVAQIAATDGSRDDPAVCGSVMVGSDGHRGWVYYLAVAPTYRIQGLGRRLMLEAEQWLRARDVPKIQAMIRRDNLAVRGFYGRLGYEDGDVQLVQKWLSDEENGGSSP